VTSFQWVKPAVHMVCCTRSRMWRQQKPQRYDTVLLWMGTSPDSHFKLTARGIPAQGKCLLSSRMLNWVLKVFIPWYKSFEQGTYIRLQEK
jgi:hypothetical protein